MQIDHACNSSSAAVAWLKNLRATVARIVNAAAPPCQIPTTLGEALDPAISHVKTET